ncbi:acetolactate decarboxylase, partial [Staphylococcus arlettae]
IAASGFHLHFINDDKTFGGHVLNFELNKGTIEVSKIETLEQHFPVNNEAFLTTDIDYANIDEDIRETE